MIMKRLINIMVLMLLALSLSSQTIERQVIGAAGSDAESQGVKVSSTVGEAVDDNFMTGSIKLYQGFQQAKEEKMGTIIEDNSYMVVDYKVYPNPVTNHLFVELEAQDETQLTLEVVNTQGVVIINKLADVTEYENRFRINVSELKAGTYILAFRQGARKAAESVPFEKVNR
jgi:hypothetical protein